MKFLILLCTFVGVAVGQLPNYFQGQFNVPNPPTHTAGSGGAWNGAGIGSGALPHAAYPQAANYAGASLGARSAYSAGVSPAAAQYAPSPSAYAGQQVPSAPAPAPVAAVPSSYGWNVQHTSPSPPQPQLSQAAAPQSAAYAQQAQAQYQPQYQQQYQPQYQQQLPQQYQSYAAPQAVPQSVPQYSPQAQIAAQQQQAAQRYARAPAPAFQAPASPVSTALLRPASVHYANIGENLNGDYKFGYRTGNGDSFREEARAQDGSVQGQYGFVDADGKQRIVKYTAGVNGFQVLNGEGGGGSAAAAAPAAAAPSAPQWASQSYAAPAPAAAAPAASQYTSPQGYGAPAQSAAQWG